MPGEMTERRQLLLKLVIQEFVQTASPVSSKSLAESYRLGVSTATIRNELAVLEELGYLTHRHTSDGRVPTDAGYRYFVENLMDRAALSANEQRTIRHQFSQVGTELAQWIELAGAVLARTTQNLSVVTPPRVHSACFKHLELVGVHETTVLVVLVLQDGTLRQQTVALDRVYQQEELHRISRRLCERCSEANLLRLSELLELERLSPTLDPTELRLLELVTEIMRRLEEQEHARIYSDGLIEILAQPEFTQVNRVRQMVEIIQGGKILSPLIPQALASSGVQVMIGGEHGVDEMREYSVVLSRYGIDGSVVGVLGIIGPTRMAYPRSISTVRYISIVMSDLLGKLYRGEPLPYES